MKKRIISIFLVVALLIAALPVLNVAAASNEEQIFIYLVQTMKLNNAAAAGVLANIYCESGFNPTIGGDGGTSYGLCQWHATRKTALINYCNSHGYDYRTINGQMHYLEYELTNSYPGVLSTLRSVSNDANGAYNAAYKWCYSFEIPANYPSVSVTRGNLAKNTYWPKWKDYTVTPPVTYSTVIDGVYLFATVHNNDYVMGVAGNSNDGSANIELQKRSYTNNYQKFVVVRDESTGNYFIRNLGSGKNLDVDNAGKDNGTNLQQWTHNGSTAQQWKFEPKSDGSFVLHPAHSLALGIDLSGGGVSQGNNVQLWTYNNNANMHWKMIRVNELPDGQYKLAANSGNFVLNVAGNSNDSAANVHLWDRANNSGDQWVIRARSDGFYTIRAYHSGLYLDVNGGVSDNGTNVQQYSYNGNNSQLWSAVPNTDGTWGFASACGDKYLDVSGGVFENARNVQIWVGNGGGAQKWKLEAQRTVVDGVYRIASSTTTSQVLTIEGAGVDAPYTAYMLKDAGGEETKVVAEYVGNGNYTLRLLHSNYFLDVYGNDKKPGSDVVQYQETKQDNQKWRIVSVGDGTYELMSINGNLCLDRTNGGDSDGTNIIAWTPNQGNAQKWSIGLVNIEVDGLWSIAPAGNRTTVLTADANDNLGLAAPVKDSKNQQFVVQFVSNSYVIRAYDSFKEMNVSNNSAANGTNALVYGAGTVSDNEKFSIIPNADGSYSFASLKTGTYLDRTGNALTAGTNAEFNAHDWNDAGQKWDLVQRYQTLPNGIYSVTSAKDAGFALAVDAATMTENGANVQLKKTADNDSQKFTVNYVGNGAYTVANTKTGKLLDIHSGSRLSGVNIHMWDTANVLSQKWLLIPQMDGTYSFVSCCGGMTLDVENGTMADGTNVRTYTGNGTAAQQWNMNSLYHDHQGTELLSGGNATCTTSGMGTYRCSICGESFQKEVPALGHVEVVDPAVAPTCSAAGKTEGTHCSRCGATVKAQQTVAALPHTEVKSPAVPATCVMPGKTEGSVCSVCGTVVKVQQTVKALGHDYRETTTATCTMAGESIISCSRCSYSIRSSVPALGHSFVSYVNNGDTHTSACTRCSNSYTSKHTYQNGVCICGAKETSAPASDLVFVTTSFSLEDKVVMNTLAANSVLGKYDSCYVEFKNLDSTDERMVLGSTDSGSSYSAKYTIFSLPINVCQMTDRFSATLYGVKGGKTYQGQTVTTSVEKFVLSILPGMNADQQKMCANMLYYGAKMQASFGYRMDHFADDELGTYQKLVVKDVPAITGTTAVTSNGYTDVTLSKRALSVGAAIELQYAIKVASTLNVNDLYAVFTVKGKTTRVEGKDFIKSGSRYVAVFADLMPNEGDEDIQLTVYSKTTGKPVSETYTDRLSYAVADYQMSGVQTVCDAVNALLNYYRLAKIVYK